MEASYHHVSDFLPLAEYEKTAKKLARYEPRSMTSKIPIVWDRAEGCQVYDAYGNCWIDFTSAIVLTNIGHAHEKVGQAIKDQIDRKLMHNYCHPSEIRAETVRRLVEISPANLEKVMLFSTGSEAVECCIKLTRMHGQSIRPDKNVLIAFNQAFHGRTLGAQSLSGFENQKQWITHRDPDIHHIPFSEPYNCPWCKAAHSRCSPLCFERALDQLRENGVDLNRIAGFITESYQGPTVEFIPNDYAVAMRQWANDHDALLVFDEVQSGFGRTGKLFAYEHYGVEADLVSCGKGITGSLPLSAVLGRAKIMDIPDPGEMSSTHTGNPLCCAAALATLDVFKEEGLVERAATLGRRFKSELGKLGKKYPCVGPASGKGMTYGLYLVKPETQQLDFDLVPAVWERALRKGVMTLPTPVGALKLSPPLSIPEDALLEGIGLIDEAIYECTIKPNTTKR